LAAALHGQPKDLIFGEHLRLQRRSQRQRNAAVAILAVLLLAATGFAGAFAYFWTEARARQRVAVARQLSLQSEALRDQQPRRLELAALLAAESVRRLAAVENGYALQVALSLLARPDRTLNHGE